MQAEAEDCEEALTAASLTKKNLDLSHNFTKVGPGLHADLPSQEPPLLEFDSSDWSFAARLSEVTEPTCTDALPPLRPADIDLEVLHPARTISQWPTAMQQPSGTPSFAAQGTTQSVQQSSYDGLSTAEARRGPSRELSASCWPRNDELLYLATPASPGLRPTPRDDAPVEWQPASELQECNLPGQSDHHDQPAGSRTGRDRPCHQVPTARHRRPKHPKHHAGRMPLPSMPAGSFQRVMELPAVSGGELTPCRPCE